MHSTTCSSFHPSYVSTRAADTLRSLGADVDDASGDGPGTFDVRGNVWHLDCCNANNNQDGNGWLIFGAITGWTNSATRKPFFSSFASLLFLMSIPCSWHCAILRILLAGCHRCADGPQVARGPRACIRVRECSW